MNRADPIGTDIVLVGGGHAHVAVLRSFAMRPEPGVRLTLVARELEAPYSGMLPGLVAGRYTPDECHIDLARLATFAGARLIHGVVEGVDTLERRISIAGRPPLAYDLLSLDVGITPDLGGIAGAARHALAVKPISTFWPRWAELEARAMDPAGPRRFVVVGGGAAGFELVLAIAARLREGARARGLANGDFRFTQVAGAALLEGLAERARQLGRSALQRHGIDFVERDQAIEVTAAGVRLGSGREIAADTVLVATRAAAPGWFKGTGLPLDEEGYLAARPTLQLVGLDDVFAAGDCASVLDHPRPKAGVFAVRQGPVLADNLRRRARGATTRPFRPQKRFLSLLSTADGRAIAVRGSVAAEGLWAFRWKDWIDRRFMRRFNDLPEMQGDEEMRCGGCAAKVGPLTLAGALDRFGHGDGPRDDAAVIDTGGDDVRLETVDFFRAFWPDPFVLGRIAAHHAMSDVLAMGGTPEFAQAICVLPYARPRVQAEDLYQLLAGARAAFAEADVNLVGGHTSEGAELAIGFAISGRAPKTRVMSKGGLKPGDGLVLTRPIGTGILFAAAMRGKAGAAALFTALGMMQQSQAGAVALLGEHGVTAATDVTGFGLAGHLTEMLEASQVSATLDLSAVPLLPGVAALAGAGIASTLLPENLALADRLSGGFDAATMALLFDPQTAGGILAGMPMEEAAAVVATGGFALIGRVEARGVGAPLRLSGRLPGL